MFVCASSSVCKQVRFGSDGAPKDMPQSVGRGSGVSKCSKGVAAHPADGVILVDNDRDSDCEGAPFSSPNHYVGVSLFFPCCFGFINNFVLFIFLNLFMIFVCSHQLLCRLFLLLLMSLLV